MQEKVARQDVRTSATDGAGRSLGTLATPAGPASGPSAGREQPEPAKAPLRPFGKATPIPSSSPLPGTPPASGASGETPGGTPASPGRSAVGRATPATAPTPSNRRDAAGRLADGAASTRAPSPQTPPSARTGGRAAGPARDETTTRVPAGEADHGGSARAGGTPSAPPPARHTPTDASRALGRRILAKALLLGNGNGGGAQMLERNVAVSAQGSHVLVLVPSAFIAEYLARHTLGTIRQAAFSVLSSPEVAPGGVGSLRAQDLAVEIVVDPSLAPRATHPGVQGGTASTVEVVAPSPRRRALPARDLRHRLSEFVVGECNRLAYTAACAIAEGTAPTRFSPLFLHGPSGVGKTHLLQGLAHRAAERLGDHQALGSDSGPRGARVRYTTAETFTNDFVQALKSSAIEGFRRAFREVEVLCIDDIHFLAGKSATQAEFLHTFDTLGLSGRMVVLASDESPREIRSLSEALVSRFLSGACIKVDPPDDKTRVELIRTLSASRGLALDDDALDLISERAGRPLPGGTIPSVREIEGLLTRVEALRRFTSPGEHDAPGGLIGRSMVAKALGLSMPEGRAARRPVPSSVIIDRVCRALRVDASDLMGRGRHTRVVLARSLVTYLCRRLTTMSYPEIARSIARPNHSSVITAFQRVERQMAAGELIEGGPDLADVTIQSLAERLERELTQAAG